MRLHLVALPHTQVSADFCGCAYTAKTLKFCRMMGRRGWDITLYAPEGPDVEGAELVEVLSDAERVGIFGPDDPGRLPAWPSVLEFAPFNVRVAAQLAERVERKDIVLLTAGTSHEFIAQSLPHLLHCEPFVGYEGIFTERCAFESNAWRHYLYGKWAIADGRWYDTVIPNFFDPVEFPHVNDGRGEYLLFFGRLIDRKGPHIAEEIARHLGLRLVVAGAGARVEPALEHEWGYLESDHCRRLDGPGVEYVGPVGVEERARLLSSAKALIAPTTYVEPFGGVAVEAMLAGTPAITTPWGAFSETVEDGVTGFTFSTLAEAVAAVERADELDPWMIRGTALSRYSLEAIAPKFEAWFERLGGLWEGGWYTLLEEVAA